MANWLPDAPPIAILRDVVPGASASVTKLKPCVAHRWVLAAAVATATSSGCAECRRFESRILACDRRRRRVRLHTHSPCEEHDHRPWSRCLQLETRQHSGMLRTRLVVTGTRYPFWTASSLVICVEIDLVRPAISCWALAADPDQRTAASATSSAPAARRARRGLREPVCVTYDISSSLLFAERKRPGLRHRSIRAGCLQAFCAVYSADRQRRKKDDTGRLRARDGRSPRPPLPRLLPGCWCAEAGCEELCGALHVRMVRREGAEVFDGRRQRLTRFGFATFARQRLREQQRGTADVAGRQIPGPHPAKQCDGRSASARARSNCRN